MPPAALSVAEVPDRPKARAAPAHIAELDGIRGLAVLLVLMFHFSSRHPGGQTILDLGWCGVDLFFVLSGFLITGILLDKKLRTDWRHPDRNPLCLTGSRWRRWLTACRPAAGLFASSGNYFRSFYMRRVLRIFPLYYAVLLVVFLVLVPVARSHGSRSMYTALPSSESEQIWYWLYVSNWRSAWGAYLGEPVGHFWSLAIEEQFYLVWPLMVWLCSRKRLLTVCSAMVVVSFLGRNIPMLREIQAVYGDFLHRVTFSRLDGLAAGAIVALLVRDERILGRLTRWSGWIAGAALCLPLAVLAWLRTADLTDVNMACFGYSAFAISFAAVVLYAATRAGASAPVAALLRCGFLCSFGRYSYGMYVLHPLFTPFIRNVWTMAIPNHWTLFSVGTGIAISWLAAWCSWHGFERRFLALKTRF
ncbi:MAG: acyltransferase [Bryobacteraceae bacterium]